MNTFMKQALLIKADHISAHEEGTFKQKFAEECGGELLDLLRENESVALDSVVTQVWDHNKGKVRVEDEIQMEIVFENVPCMQSIRFKDDTVPGSWLTLSIMYATVYQYGLFIDAGNERLMATKSKQALNEGILLVAKSRANGDMTKRMVELIDEEVMYSTVK